MSDKFELPSTPGVGARVEAHIRGGFVMAFAVIAMLMFLSVRSISGLIQNAGWVEHTMTVIDQVDRLDGLLMRTENFHRLYLLTHDARFLSSYAAASAEAAKTADSLCDLTLDNPPQQQRMLQVRSLLQQRDQELRRLAADS
ncbi:MAG: CHASE3 domain-containing protein, partial [Acidobacteriaceae bacterium]